MTGNLGIIQVTLPFLVRFTFEGSLEYLQHGCCKVLDVHENKRVAVRASRNKSHPRTFGILKFLFNTKKAETDKRQTFAETVNPGGVHDDHADGILFARPGSHDERVAVDVRVFHGNLVNKECSVNIVRDARLVDGLTVRVVAHDTHAGGVQVQRRTTGVSSQLFFKAGENIWWPCQYAYTLWLPRKKRTLHGDGVV